MSLDQGPIEIVIHGCLPVHRPGVVAYIERLFRESAQLRSLCRKVTVRCVNSPEVAPLGSRDAS